MRIYHAISARQNTLDRVHAIALRITPDRLLALAGEFAPIILASLPDCGMTEGEVIDALVHEALAREIGALPPARGTAPERFVA